MQTFIIFKFLNNPFYSDLLLQCLPSRCELQWSLFFTTHFLFNFPLYYFIESLIFWWQFLFRLFYIAYLFWKKMRPKIEKAVFAKKLKEKNIKPFLFWRALFFLTYIDLLLYLFLKNFHTCENLFYLCYHLFKSIRCPIKWIFEKTEIKSRIISMKYS